MFGYVRLDRPEIKMGEYEQYRGIYCTLCRRLGRRYGLHARMTLSYDLTFLALLQTALSPQFSGFRPGRCSFNTAKRCPRCIDTAAIDRAADIGVLLTYHKLRDTVADERGPKRLAAALALPLAALDRRRAQKRQPEAARRIAEMMRAQARLEHGRTDKIDAAADPFAALLSFLAAETAQDERERRVLSRFGYCLGRWIYLIDATDDLTEDARRGRYNPILLAHGVARGDTAAADRLRPAQLPVLNACLAQCIAAYELLDIRRFDGILRNILQKGMPDAQRRAIAGKEETHGTRSV